QVDQHVDDGEHEDHRLHGGVVARQHGVHGETAEPGDAVDRLGDDHAADQHRDADADDGDDGDGGVAQHVAQQHRQPAEPLGPRGAHVVRVENLQHAGARDARDERDEDHGQRDAGQDQPLEKAADAVADPLVALHGQPRQLDGEDVDEHVADHEDGHREAEHREAHHSAVEPAAAPPGAQHRERDASYE